MNALAVTLCVVCQILLVTGQIFLKHAANALERTPRSWPRVAGNFAAGIACMSGWFLLWVGLLQTWPLSEIFPFEGINPLLLALGAWIFLKERLPAAAWTGIALICVGIALVSGS